MPLIIVIIIIHHDKAVGRVEQVGGAGAVGLVYPRPNRITVVTAAENESRLISQESSCRIRTSSKQLVNAMLHAGHPIIELDGYMS